MVAPRKGLHTRRVVHNQWVLAAVAGLAACVGLIVAGGNAYLASQPYFSDPETSFVAPATPGLAHALSEGMAPTATVQLTPELVRALLTMDEKDQLALVVDPKTDEEKAAQLEVMTSHC